VPSQKIPTHFQRKARHERRRQQRTNDEEQRRRESRLPPYLHLTSYCARFVSAPRLVLTQRDTNGRWYSAGVEMLRLRLNSNDGSVMFGRMGLARIKNDQIRSGPGVYRVTSGGAKTACARRKPNRHAFPCSPPKMPAWSSISIHMISTILYTYDGKATRGTRCFLRETKDTQRIC